MRDAARAGRPSWRLALPFVVVASAGLISVELPPHRPADGVTTAMWASWVVVLALLVWTMRTGRDDWTHALPPLAFLVTVALARHATGGTDSGLPSLIGLPILWLAITGTARQLRAAAVGTALVFVVPMALIGAPQYPLDDWRRALMWTLFAGLVAPVVQSYVTRLVVAENRWRALVEHLPDTTVMLVDEQHRVRLATGAGARRQRLERTVGHCIGEIRDDGNRELMLRLVDDAFSAARAGSASEGIQLTATRTGHEHEVRAIALPGVGDQRLALVVAQDLSPQRAQQRALAHATQRSEQLFADAPHGIALIDDRGILQRGNAALAAMVGVDVDELPGRRFRDLVRPGLRAHQHLARAVEAGEAVSDDFELAVPVRDRDGRHGGHQRVDVVVTSTVLESAAGRSSGGRRVLVSYFVDVSERRRYEDRLAHMADHDALTGLANRRLFDAALNRHRGRCEVLGVAGAVLLIDLDNFKLVNDTLGHAAGDELLAGLADLLRSTLRATDVVARLGGDEFAVLMREGDAAEMERVAHRVVESIAAHTALLEGARRRVSASGGLVTFAAAAAHGSDVLALADMTMYDAKDAGRNRVVVLDDDGSAPPRTTSMLHWQRRVAEALDADEFELVLQPVAALRGPAAPMAEVLLRLRDEDHLVGPEAFLHIAERTGLATRIDAWVLRHAIPMLASLRADIPDLCLTVNLSGLSIGDPTVEEQLVRSLREAQVPATALVLEITETAAVRDLWRAREFAARITALGCRFALDDFGAGFGSFAYLKHLPFDYVKIDGEFIADLRTSSVNQVLLRSIVSIAGELGKATIAEHVGDDWTLEFLRREGVALVQGFHVAPPMPPAEIAEGLRSAAALVDAGQHSARLW